jgi:hypothetical protein
MVIVLLLPRYPRIFHLPPLTLSVLIWTAAEVLMLVKALVVVWMVWIYVVLLGIVVVLVKLLPLQHIPVLMLPRALQILLGPGLVQVMR